MRRFALAAAVALTGCFEVDVQSFAGKNCDVAAGCPRGYSCVRARPGQGSTCELLQPPKAEEIAPAYYCGEVEPILKKHCLENCHGADHSGSPTNTNFRLDMYYASNGVLGAQDQAQRIKSRGADKAPTVMPPPPFQELSSGEKQTKKSSSIVRVN